MSKAKTKHYVEKNSYNNFLDYYVVHLLLLYLISSSSSSREQGFSSAECFINKQSKTF